MKYENVLLIGGPKDGVRMSVLEGVPSIRCAVLPKTPATRYEGPGVMECVTVEEVIYRREPMHSGMGFRGAVYVIGNDVDALPTLVDGYRGSRDAFESLALQKGYNTDQEDGVYMSKMTTELYEFWCGGRK